MSDEELKQKKRRNLAIAVGILAFIVLVYATTIIRIGANAAAGG